MGDLPRLFSTSRRARNMTTVSSHLWGSVVFCIEYPNGVYVNDKGVVCLDEDVSEIPEDDEVRLVDRSSPEYQKLSFEERQEQVQLRRDRTNNAEFGKYYSDPDYSDDDDVASQDQSSTDDALTEEEEETMETNSESENESVTEIDDDDRLDSEADEDEGDGEDDGEDEEEEKEEKKKKKQKEMEMEEEEEKKQKEMNTNMDVEMYDEEDEKDVKAVSKLHLWG